MKAYTGLFWPTSFRNVLLALPQYYSETDKFTLVPLSRKSPFSQEEQQRTLAKVNQLTGRIIAHQTTSGDRKKNTLVANSEKED